MNPKHAIILRGPPAIGKTSVTGLLVTKIPSGQSKRIDLDLGWGRNEGWRYEQGDQRYADLKANEDFLILELGCGEPGDWSFNGATRNPREWISILEKEGRYIHLFRLLTDFETWKQRLLKKVPEGDQGAEQYFSLFDRDEWKQFPTTACLQEELIDTTTIDQTGVANRIWKRIEGETDGRGAGP